MFLKLVPRLVLHTVLEKSQFIPFCLCDMGMYSHTVFISVSFGEGNGTPLQYSCLENPMDRGTWKAAVHGVVEGQTLLSYFTFTFHFHALEKEMDGGAWWAAVYGVAQSRTRLM